MPDKIDREERLDRKLDKKEKQEQEAKPQTSQPASAEQAPASVDTRGTNAAQTQKLTRAAAVSEVNEILNSLAALKQQPSLAGPQVAPSIQAAETQLKAALTEAQRTPPADDRMVVALNGARVALEQAAGTSPVLSSMSGRTSKLWEAAKAGFNG